MIWYEEQGQDDIIISTRIRLARNLEKYPFPNRMTVKQAQEARDLLEGAITNSNSALTDYFKIYHMSETDEIEKQMLAEKHLISSELLKKQASSAMIGKDENMSIMLMEEDHLRIQVIMGGYKLDEAYETAGRVDDVIDENVRYAYDKDFGYLTSCPTNTGTGMRASVMMHLPALTMTNNISRIISSAGQLGIAVRGSYGEGSKAYGCLYQISNQVTLGLGEKEIIEKVKNIVNQIAEHERDARKKLCENNKDYIEDKLWRSYGLLKYGKVISSSEAKSLLSEVLMGKSMGIIPYMGVNLTELMILTEPAAVECRAKRRLTPNERDRERARLLNEKMKI